MPSSTPMDLRNLRFGRLTAIERTETATKPYKKWLCRCDCGALVTVSIGHLRHGHTLSCGCLQRDVVRARSFGNQYGRIHGHTHRTGERSRTYHSWEAMKGRCLDPANVRYALYGGRGITICDDWLNDFTAFLRDMGERPDGRTLDRIDVDGNYEPSNCRWATPLEQTQNRRKK